MKIRKISNLRMCTLLATIVMIVAGLCVSCASHALTLTSVSPGFGPVAGGTKITITGTGFEQNVRWKQIVGGNGFSCALTIDGKVYCWGVNDVGQLGNGTSGDDSILTPVAVDTSDVLNGKTIISLAAGIAHVCALANDHQVYCWGRNDYGQLGNGTMNTLSDPTPNPVAVDTSGVLNGKTVVSLTAGGIHNCVLASDGKVYCWGQNDYNQLGDGTATARSVPTAVIDTGDVLYSGGKTVVNIEAGYYNTCAIASNGRVYCWGYNDEGQLGDGTRTGQPTPVAVVDAGNVLYSGGKTIISLAVGYAHTCAIASDHQVYCWGGNSMGQLGDGTSSSKLAPILINGGGLSGKTIVAITACVFYTCALTSDGIAYCWGFNWAGQLGDGTTTNRSSPVAVVDAGNVLYSGGKTVTGLIASEGFHTCAVASDDGAYCWGSNWGGELGDGTTTEPFDPVPNPVAVDTSNLLAIPTVTIDGVVCTEVTILSDTELTCVVPAHIRGLTDVALFVNGATITLPNAFEYKDVLDAPNSGVGTETNMLDHSIFEVVLIIGSCTTILTWFLTSAKGDSDYSIRIKWKEGI